MYRDITFKLVFYSLFLLSYKSIALDIPVNIKGAVVIPPCSINNGELIEVNFHRMNLDKIDGNNFGQSITVALNCDYYQGAAYINMSGEKLPGAPDNVLKANVSQASTQEFGLAFYQGSTISNNYAINIGIKTSITTGLSDLNQKNGLFVFTVVPWKKKNWLQAGDFSATAALSISYI